VDPASARRIADNGCGRRPGIRRRQACRYKIPPCVRIAGDFRITASGKIRTVDMPKAARDALEPPSGFYLAGDEFLDFFDACGCGGEIRGDAAAAHDDQAVGDLECVGNGVGDEDA
jgi:hypothetical protein